MIRSVEFPCDPRWVKNPTNNPLATSGQRMGAAAQTRLCIATIGEILSECFTRPTPFYRNDTAREVGSAYTVPNLWTVTLTRISMGTLDPLTGGASMKAVQDAVATWCEVKNERDPVWKWIEPIRQEKRKKKWFGVRIELDDLAPGEPRHVVLVSIDRFVAKAKAKLKAAQMVKRLVTKAAKGATKVQTKSDTIPEAAFRAASHRRLKDGDDGVTRRNGVLEKAGVSARAAAEAAFAKVTKPTTKPARPDPDAEAIAGMREQARSVACPSFTCGALVGAMCNGVGEPFEYGVHAARARAAGLPPYPSAAELNAGMRPVRTGEVCGLCKGACRGLNAVTGARDGDPCPRCNGSGKVAAWAWQRPPFDAAAVILAFLKGGARPEDAIARHVDDLAEKHFGDEGYSSSQVDTTGTLFALVKAGRLTWRDPPGGDGEGTKPLVYALVNARPLKPRPDGDPGEERPARDLAPCSTCGAAVGEACSGGAGLLFGVHAARAKAAGLAGVPTPTKAPTNGVRKLAPVAGPLALQAWARLPWGRPQLPSADESTCAACGCTDEKPCSHADGSVACSWSARHDTICSRCKREPVREPRRDGADPPRAVRYRVPAEHVARFGPEVVLIRRPHVDASGEPCWLYA